MHVVIDAVGVRGQGSEAILTELLQWLPRIRPDWRWHVFLLDRQFREFDDPEVPDSVVLEQTASGNTRLQRLRWIGRELPSRVTTLGADVLLSFVNLAPPKPLVPQVVFVHQLLAFSNNSVPRHRFLVRCRMRLMRNRILAGARASRAVIVQTNAMRTAMEMAARDLRGRIHVIPSGYRTRSQNPVVRAEKKALIEDTSPPRLIYVSHAWPHKNHVTMVRALPRIIRRFPSARLLFTLERANSPNIVHCAWVVREIAAVVQQLGLGEHLAWLGILNADEVDYALSESDLLLFPSLAESFGLPLVEAMACRCPIAASDLPYAHDVAGEAAVYFDPHDPTDIADKVTSVLSDAAEIQRLKRKAEHRKGQFSYRLIATQIADLLERSAGQNGLSSVG